MKRSLLMILFFSAIGCNEWNPIARQGQDASAKSAPEERPSKQEEFETAPSDSIRSLFKVAYKLDGFGGSHQEKMISALTKLSWVVKSDVFRDKVLNHQFQGKKQFYKNKGLTNRQIYLMILKGAETLSPEVDHEMDLRLTLYHNSSNTVGYTYPNTSEIWVNRKYFEKYSLAEVANNAMHEWLHKIGFEHSFYNNSDRPYTVPYAIGEIVEEIINNSENFR